MKSLAVFCLMLFCVAVSSAEENNDFYFKRNNEYVTTDANEIVIKYRDIVDKASYDKHIIELVYLTHLGYGPAVSKGIDLLSEAPVRNHRLRSNRDVVLLARGVSFWEDVFWLELEKKENRIRERVIYYFDTYPEDYTGLEGYIGARVAWESHKATGPDSGEFSQIQQPSP